MFQDASWVVWLALALALVAIEAATVDFIFLMLAGGAVGGSIAAGLGLPFLWQTVIAAVLSVLLLLLVRPWAKRRFRVASGHRGIGTASLLGRPAQILQEVTATGGQVRIDGQVWSARSVTGAAYPVGTPLDVKAIEGATAIVGPHQDAPTLPAD